MHPGGKGCVDLVGLIGVDGGCEGWQLEGGVMGYSNISVVSGVFGLAHQMSSPTINRSYGKSYISELAHQYVYYVSKTNS